MSPVRKVVSANDVRAAARGAERVLRAEPGSLVTPLARDLAKEFGVTIDLGRAQPAASAARPAQPPASAPTRALVREVAKRVLARSHPGAGEKVLERVVDRVLERWR